MYVVENVSLLCWTSFERLLVWDLPMFMFLYYHIYRKRSSHPRSFGTNLQLFIIRKYDFASSHTSISYLTSEEPMRSSIPPVFVPLVDLVANILKLFSPPHDTVPIVDISTNQSPALTSPPTGSSRIPSQSLPRHQTRIPQSSTSMVAGTSLPYQRTTSCSFSVLPSLS